MRHKLRYPAGFLAACIMAVATLFAMAPPASAAGNGIQVGHFAYTPETDPTGWLNNICNVADEKPEFVVLNIGNGHTDDVGKLDVLAEDCQAAGVKTLGYVHLVDSLDYDSDSNTTELRTRIQVGADVDYWTSPFNPERTNFGVFLDGIMLDQMPADCGSVTYIADVTDMVHDKWTFWSYGTPLVMGNAGTAIRDCIPGFNGYMGAIMPDRYITFEGTYATYAASYLGGNVSDGSVYYNGENTFGQDMFVHIVYDADQSEMEAATRLADDRGAAFIFATDDVLANPYDAPPSYMDADTRWAATPHMIFDDGYDGIEFAYTGSPSMPFLAQIKLRNNLNTGDSDLVVRIRDLILTPPSTSAMTSSEGSRRPPSSRTMTAGIRMGPAMWPMRTSTRMPPSFCGMFSTTMLRWKSSSFSCETGTKRMETPGAVGPTASIRLGVDALSRTTPPRAAWASGAGLLPSSSARTTPRFSPSRDSRWDGPPPRVAGSPTPELTT